MVKDYRNKVGQRIGVTKLYSELNNQLIEKGVKMDRDNFFTFLRNNSLLVHKLKTIILLRNLIINFKNIKT
tara:strand:+ start:315 stop:527 length:213 start_codon:yes stop_codon:yes gene_type:complete